MGKRRKIHINDLSASERHRAESDFDAIPTSRRKVRAYFDANIPVRVAERVRKALRWDVLCVQQEPELRNRDDEFHYANARKLRRIIFSLDKDFLDDRRFPLHQSPGVYVLHAKHDDSDDIYHAIRVASMTVTEAYRKLADFCVQSKAEITFVGQRLRYLTKDSEVHELFSPH